jgi:hypothetical protein
MSRQWIFAAATAATLVTTPSLAEPWRNYDGYRPIPPIASSLPYGMPIVAYTVVTVAVPVVTYAPMQVRGPIVTYVPVRARLYDIPQEPPYYNVPPYIVYAPH